MGSYGIILKFKLLLLVKRCFTKEHGFNLNLRLQTKQMGHKWFINVFLLKNNSVIHHWVHSWSDWPQQGTCSSCHIGVNQNWFIWNKWMKVTVKVRLKQVKLGGAWLLFYLTPWYYYCLTHCTQLSLFLCMSYILQISSFSVYVHIITLTLLAEELIQYFQL